MPREGPHARPSKKLGQTDFGAVGCGVDDATRTRVELQLLERSPVRHSDRIVRPNCRVRWCRKDVRMRTRGPPVAPGPWKLEDLGVRTLGAPSVIRDSKQIVAFYQGENGHLWMSTHANNDRWWSKAWDLGGTALTCAPAAIALSDNRYHVFYCGPNRHLWMSGWDDGPGWTSPVDLGGVVLQSRPAVVALGATTYRIFYKGPNGHLWVSSWDGGAWWSAPDDLGGVILSSAPTAATVNGEPHHIAVFYAGPNGHLTMSGYNGGPWWSMPIDLRGEQLSGDPSVVSPAEHELDVFYTNSSGDLFQSQWTGGPWWSAPYSRDIKGVAGVGALTGTEVYVRNPTGDLSVAHPWLK